MRKDFAPRMEKRMRTLERKPHAGCSWIVDQLVGIRSLEEQLIAALASGDQRGSKLIRSRLGELDRWVDMLDRALDESLAADRDQVVRRITRCTPRSEWHPPEAGLSPQHGRRGWLLRRTG